MKKLLMYLLLTALSATPAYGFAGRFGAYTKNLYQKASTRFVPAPATVSLGYKRFLTPKAAVATGLAIAGTTYAYKNPEKVAGLIGIDQTYSILNVVNKKSLLTEHYAKNITTLNAENFNKIIKQDPQAAKVLTPYAAQHIDEMNPFVLIAIIDEYPEAAKIFTQPAAQHIDTMHPMVLGKILAVNPEAAISFYQTTALHFDKMNPWFFLKNMCKIPQACEPITQAASLNILHIYKNNSFIFDVIMIMYPPAERIFQQSAIQQIRQNIAQIDPEVLKYFMYKDPIITKPIFTKALDATIKDLKNTQSKPLNNLLLSENYKIVTGQEMPKVVYQNDSPSQTGGHLATNSSSIVAQFGSTLLSDQQAVTFLEKVFNQERKEIAEDRYVFHHACQWKWDLAQDFYTHLYYTLQDKQVPLYRFLRFDNTTTNLEEEKAIRKKIMRQGEPRDLRPRLLFMNHAIFGNSDNEGSCTAQYWYENADWSRTTISAPDIFKKLNRPDIYEKYKEDIQKIEILHKQAENKGTWLLLSFDKKFLKNSVYAAAPCGYKTQVLIDNQNVDKVSKILTTLKTNPEKLGSRSDALEYCLALTKDLALNPEYAGKDIKIYPFNTAKPKEYGEYCAKRDELMAKIKADLHSAKTIKITEGLS